MDIKKETNHKKPLTVEKAKTTENTASAPSQPIQNDNVAIIGMIIGITALLMCIIPVLGLIMGVTGIALSIVAVKKNCSKGLSITGLITSGMAIIINLIVTLFMILGIILAANVAVQVANDQIDNNQTAINAKKSFNKGEAAIFNNIQVKVNSLQRNYVPADASKIADEGKEYIVVNLDVKNISQNTINFNTLEIRLNADGVTNTTNGPVVEPIMAEGELSSGATTTGNIVYEIKKGASDLKLQYETSIYDYDMPMQVNQKLTYTLAI